MWGGKATVVLVKIVELGAVILVDGFNKYQEQQLRSPSRRAQYWEQPRSCRTLRLLDIW